MTGSCPSFVTTTVRFLEFDQTQTLIEDYFFFIPRTESDLLSKLKSVARETEEAKAESEVAGKESLATSILSNMKVKSMEKHEEQKPLDDMPVGEPRERFGMKLLWHRHS